MILMGIHHSEINTPSPIEFLYTRCTDLYSTMAENTVSLPKAVCKIWEIP